MNVLSHDNEFLKCIEIWKRIEALFSKKNNKKFNKPVYNSEYIKTKIWSYSENFKLTKDEYCGNSILLLESICEVENIILKHFYTNVLNPTIIKIAYLNSN